MKYEPFNAKTGVIWINPVKNIIINDPIIRDNKHITGITFKCYKL